MPQKAEYTDKYGNNISSLKFDCGAGPPSKAAHGSLSTAGIEGAQPKRFTAERAQPHLSTLNLAEATQGKSKFRPPAQPRNPLDPNYHLPTAKPLPIEVPKFIRDNMDVSDIQGAHKTASKPLIKPQSSLDTSDIQGSKQQPHLRGKNDGNTKDSRFDVSDIAVKAKSLAPRKVEEKEITPVEDGMGKHQGTEWRKERYESLRRHGNDVIKVRHAAESALASVVSEANSANTAALEAHFKAVDKSKSGFLLPKEFEAAVQRSGVGIAPDKVKEISKALQAADGTGLVSYHDMLARLYDKDPPQDAPQWYSARQRKLKTDVATTLGQQPSATAAAAAQITTQHERCEQTRPAYGKRIDAQVRSQEAHQHGENYWFADFHGDPVPASTENDAEDGVGLWFSKDGEDEESLHQMATWRPTKDAKIAIDLRKERKKQQQGDVNGHGEGQQPKAALVVAKPPPPNRKAQQLSQKDVNLVRQLD